MQHTPRTIEYSAAGNEVNALPGQPQLHFVFQLKGSMNSPASHR